MRPRLVFVDAAIPDCEGEARLNPDVVDLLRPLAVDGVLPPWSVWLGQGGVERLIPNREMRARVEAELPELPVALFDDPLPVPAGWCEWPWDYLLLSEDMRAKPSEPARLAGRSSKSWGITSTSSTGRAEVAANLVRTSA